LVSTPLLAIGPEPLALEPLIAAVAGGPASEAGAHGAVATFLGLVRSHHNNRRVRYLEYEAYEPLARTAFERIAAEVNAKWPGVRLALHHRLGRIELGEASVAIAAGSAHRAEAFAACRYTIERVKQIAPIWKREFFDEGDMWVEGAIADPDDAGARAEAERVACA
jgi:molybdopterin synthase catalytic subunit